jgi:hypothetical protein
MESYIQSNDFDLGDGDKFILTKRIIPDISFDNPEVPVSAAVFTGSISATTLTVTAVASGIIYEGMVITGGTTLADTYITEFGTTGTGGTGDYVVSPSQTVTSSALTGTLTPSVEFQLRYRNFPGSALNIDPTSSTPNNVVSTTVDTFTEQVYLRVRARQVALKVGSDKFGTQWQLGSPRVDGREDGER